jgi:drug/metabolite transporter (DMT)-like permease
MADAAVRQRLARALLWLIPALWSSNYLVARLADGVVAPHALATGRWALAALVMLPFVWRGLAREPSWIAREWRQLLVLGALGMWICGAWVYIAARTTSATNIALIYAVAPVAIAFVGARLLHEPFGGARWLGVAFALAGLLIVIGKGDWRNLAAVRFSAGDGWVLAAALSWVAYSVLLRHWKSALGPAERLVATIAGGLVVLLPFTLAEAWLAPGPPWSARATLLVAVAALLPGVMSYGAYSFMQNELGAARTALTLYLAPVYGTLGAWLVLGEAPGWHHAAGAALILPAIWLASRR